MDDNKSLPNDCKIVADRGQEDMVKQVIKAENFKSEV